MVYGQLRRHDFIYQRQCKLPTLRKPLFVLGNLDGRLLQVRARVRTVHGTVREQLELYQRLVELRSLWKHLLDWRKLPRGLVPETLAVCVRSWRNDLCCEWHKLRR